MREPNGREFSSIGLVVVLALPAALACAVDDRAAPGVSEGADEPGGGPDDAAPVGSAGSGPLGGAGGLTGAGGSAASSAEAVNGKPAAGASGAGNTAEPSSGGTSSEVSAAGPPVVLPSALCGEQLLANGDFDAGRTGWEETWEVRETLVGRTDPLLLPTGVVPQSGEYLAWLGGVANGEYGEKYLSRLSQMVTFPEGTVSLTFSGYMWVEQRELGVMPTSDWMVIELLDPTVVSEVYDDIWQIGTWNEANVTTGWVEFTYVQTRNMDRFRGHTLQIVADSRPDGNGTMSMFLDSLQLVARCE